MYKVNDLEFQGHVIENSNYHHFFVWPRAAIKFIIGFLDPETIPMKNFTKKFVREDQIPGGGGCNNHPPWLQTLIEIAWLYAG